VQRVQSRFHPEANPVKALETERLFFRVATRPQGLSLVIA